MKVALLISVLVFRVTVAKAQDNSAVRLGDPLRANLTIESVRVEGPKTIITNSGVGILARNVNPLDIPPSRNNGISTWLVILPALVSLATGLIQIVLFVAPLHVRTKDQAGGSKGEGLGDLGSGSSW